MKLRFRWQYDAKATKAVAILGKAIKEGNLNRPDTCELCGRTPKPIPMKLKSGESLTRSPIVGHHWQGYDQPLNVLWVCCSCNGKLTGPEFHNGSMTKEQSREYVLSFTPKRPKKKEAPHIRCSKVFQRWGQATQCRNWAIADSIFCHHHQP